MMLLLLFHQYVMSLILLSNLSGDLISVYITSVERNFGEVKQENNGS